MKTSQLLSFRPMTPEDVLSVFRDEHRHAARHDPETDPDFDVRFDVTVGDWRDACDLLPVRELWPALNKKFGVDIGKSEWLSVLLPIRHRALGGVCQLIARYAQTPVVESLRIFGTNCRSAGAFLAIRTLLVREGVPIESVRPSTTLCGFAREDRRNYSRLSSVMSRLAPGVLPVPDIDDAYPRLNRIMGWLLLVGFIVFMATRGIGPLRRFMEMHLSTGIAAAIGPALVIVTLATLVWSMRQPPRSVIFADMRSFRELAATVAGSDRQRPLRR
jgi:hypothetical protein